MNKKLILLLSVISLIVGILLAEPIFWTLIKLIPSEVKFIAFNPFDGFILLFLIALMISFILFTIFLLIIIWVELKDALYKKEKDFLKKILIPVVVLFIFGFAFGIWIYTKVMLPFFINTNISLGLENFWNLKDVLINGIGMALMFGLCFQMPVLIKGLIKFGFVEKSFLKQKRGFVVVGILILSALITPTPDIFSQIVIGIPLYLLFEVGLL